MQTEKTQTGETIETKLPLSNTLSEDEIQIAKVLEDVSGESILENVSSDKLIFDPSQFEEVVDNPVNVSASPEVTRPAVTSQASLADITAPFGRDANGKRIAPYGFSKKGNVKLTGGRPGNKNKGFDLEETTPKKPAAPLSDESELISKLTPPTPPVQSTATQPAPEVVTPTPPPQPTATAAATKAELLEKYKVHISGAMALVALDFIAANVIVRLYNLIAPDKIEDKSQLKLTDEEKKDIVDLADVIVKELLETLSPLQQFLIWMSVLYGTKITYATKVPKVKKVRKVKAE